MGYVTEKNDTSCFKIKYYKITIDMLYIFRFKLVIMFI